MCQVGQQLFKKNEHAKCLRSEYRLDGAKWKKPVPEHQTEQGLHQQRDWVSHFRNYEQVLRCDVQQALCCHGSPRCADHSARFELRETPAPSEFGADAIDFECVAVVGGGCPYAHLAAGGATELEDRLTDWQSQQPSTQQPAGDLLETLTQQDEETEEEGGDDDGEPDGEPDEADEADEPDGSDTEDPEEGDHE